MVLSLTKNPKSVGKLLKFQRFADRKILDCDISSGFISSSNDKQSDMICDLFRPGITFRNKKALVAG